jgi:hypothetical protein
MKIRRTSLVVMINSIITHHLGIQPFDCPVPLRPGVLENPDQSLQTARQTSGALPMRIPLILAIQVELLREEVSCVRNVRLNVGRARIVTQLKELLLLVSSTADVERASERAFAACCDLFGALRNEDLPGLRESNRIWAARQRALEAIAELEKVLRFAGPSVEARRVGLDWPVEEAVQRSCG